MEVVMAAKNYMTQRMNIEQEELIQKCITLLSAKTMNDFVSHGLTIVRMHIAGQRCFELLALIGSPQLSFSKVFPVEQTSVCSDVFFKCFF